MPFDDPLKKFGQNAVDRLLEQQQRDRALIAGFSRPIGSIEKSLFETELARLKRMTESIVPTGMTQDVVKLKSLMEQHKSSLDRISSWSRLSAMQEATLAISRQQAVETNNSGKLALALSDQLNETTKLGFTHKDLLTKAAAGFAISEVLKQSGVYSQLNEIAGRTSSINSHFERLAKEQSSWRTHSAIDEALWHHVREAQLAMEAMTSEDGADGFVSHATSMLKALAGMFTRFKGNTANEVRDMGLFGFLAAVLSFLAIFEMLQPDGLTEAEREQLTAIQKDVRNVREQLIEFLEGEAAIDEAFVSDLPRGLTRRKAYIRTKPKRDSELIIVLPDDTPVAIYGREQRWLKVVYRDPLADQLAIGWVYRPSIDMQPN